jgi:primosomal protein N' (replication factor Y)
LLTQVAGRSGRGDKKGSVYIQTYSPNHYAIEYAKNHDYISFYNREIEKRKELSYPPFSRLVRLVIRGEDEAKVESDTNLIFDLLTMITYKSRNDLSILGPAPCMISKLKKYYRWNIIVKTKSHKLLNEFFEELSTKFSTQKGNYIEIDIDPISMI